MRRLIVGNIARRGTGRETDASPKAGASPQTEMGAGIAASPHLRRAKDMPVFVT
jgi:hypothetical protein